MAKLFLLRHIKSQWNKENRFTGWTDDPLDEDEVYDAKILADKTINRYKINKIYCSVLFRNMDTIARMFEYSKEYPTFCHLDSGKMQKWGKYIYSGDDDIQVAVSEKLNERHYGKLQGMNKEVAMAEYGKDLVHLWRRSYNIAPPGGESLKDVVRRAIPFYKKYIERDLRNGNNVLVVASHNPLRAIVKYLEKIPDKKIINLEIPYAGLFMYDLDVGLKVRNKSVL